MASDKPTGPTGPKLLEQVSRAVRARRYSPRTEEGYVAWVRRFVRYHDMRHPDELGSQEVNDFLTHLAVDRGSSASTQNQARAALIFLYKNQTYAPTIYSKRLIRNIILACLGALLLRLLQHLN